MVGSTGTLTGYNIYRESTLIGTTEQTSFTDTEPPNAINQTYYVTALYSNPTGESDQWSAYASTAAFYPPQGLTATPGNGQMTLSWTLFEDEPATRGLSGFEVYVDDVQDNEELIPLDQNSYIVTELTNGTSYTFKVKALYTTPNGENEATIDAIPVMYYPPATFTATSGNAQITLNWTAPLDGGATVTEYKIHRGLYEDFELSAYNLAYTANLLNTSWTDVALLNGTEYYYKIVACYVSPAGESEPFEADPYPVIPRMILHPPVNLQATATEDNVVTLTWEAPNIFPPTGDEEIFTHSTSEEYYGALGIGDTTEIITFMRFSTDDIAEFDVAGYQLNKVSFMVYEPDTYYEVYVFTGGFLNESNGTLQVGTQVAGQIVTGPFIPETWNEVVLNTPVPIPLNQELWIGIYVYGEGYPVCLDQGPSVVYHGDLYYSLDPDDSGWRLLPYDNNWMIRGHATPPNITAREILMTYVSSSIEDKPVFSPMGTVGKAPEKSISREIRNNPPTRGFLGFSVYRDETQINTEYVSGLTFSDTSVPITGGTFTYSVYAEYHEGTSIAATTEISLPSLSEKDTVEGFTNHTLLGNYPNPFNPETSIKFALVKEDFVTIEIYNIKGEKVKTLLNSYKNTGVHNVIWNGTNDNGNTVSSGIYFYRLRAGELNETKKMLLMK
jgi:hypothetical protein